MTGLLHSATSAISAAKTSPLALLALLIILAAWLIVAFRVRRNAQLLANLSKLPASDRLEALKIEMGHVPLKAGLSPEQWLRHRLHTYYFFSFGLLCLFVLISLAIAKFSGAPDLRTGASVSLHNPDAAASGTEEVLAKTTPPTAPPSRAPSKSLHGKALRAESSGLIAGIAVTASGPRQMAEDRVPSDRTVSYAAALENGIQHFRYQSRYLDLLRLGGPVQGFNPLNATFKWSYPEVAVNIVNNTRSLMVVSQAILTVEESSIDETPLLLIEDYSVNDLVVHNEGWGDINGGTAALTIQEMMNDGEISMYAPLKTSVSLAPFSSVTRVPIQPLLPARLRDTGDVKVSGTLTYQAGSARTISFDTHISLRVRVGAGIAATHTYKTFIQAGRAPVQIPVDLAQQIAPGAADRFYLLLGTDRTCRNRLHIDFRTAAGETVPGNTFLLDIFVPRSAADQYRG